jgi:hypothetical protein
MTNDIIELSRARGAREAGLMQDVTNPGLAGKFVNFQIVRPDSGVKLTSAE